MSNEVDIGKIVAELSGTTAEQAKSLIAQRKALDLNQAEWRSLLFQVHGTVRQEVGVQMEQGLDSPANVYKQLYILFPTGMLKRRFTGVKFQRRTREQLESSLRPMGIIGVVAEADWPLDVLSLDEEMLDDVKFQSLDEVILEDGAKYVAIYGRPDYLEQLREIAAWRGNWVGGMENEIRESLVKQLEDSGHADVQAYCGPKQLKKPGSEEVLGEIDAAALAESCALIAEVKTTLSDEALIQLIRLLDTIRDMVEEGAPMATPFKGKRLLGALAGRIMTSNSQSSRTLRKEAAARKIPILLPNGTGFSTGDGCVTAPSSPSCFASTSSKPTRHGQAASSPASRTLPTCIVRPFPSQRRSFVQVLQAPKHSALCI